MIDNRGIAHARQGPVAFGIPLRIGRGSGHKSTRVNLRGAGNQNAVGVEQEYLPIRLQRSVYFRAAIAGYAVHGHRRGIRLLEDNGISGTDGKTGPAQTKHLRILGDLQTRAAIGDGNRSRTRIHRATGWENIAGNRRIHQSRGAHHHQAETGAE